MTIPFANSFLRRLQSHPRWIGILLGIGYIAWASLLAYQFFIAATPNEAEIAGQTVRLNTAELKGVTTNLEIYRAPIDIPASPNDIFATPKP